MCYIIYFFLLKKLLKKFKWREKKFKDKYLRTYFIWGGGGAQREGTLDKINPRSKWAQLFI